jgi:sec-independent protein translocase protein TatA
LHTVHTTSEIFGEDNMPTLGGWEWVIILVIILLVFGVGRISKLGSELGKGISAFRQGVKEGQDGNKESEETTAEDGEAKQA